MSGGEATFTHRTQAVQQMAVSRTRPWRWTGRRPIRCRATVCRSRSRFRAARTPRLISRRSARSALRSIPNANHLLLLCHLVGEGELTWGRSAASARCRRSAAVPARCRPRRDGGARPAGARRPRARAAVPRADRPGAARQRRGSPAHRPRGADAPRVPRRARSHRAHSQHGLPRRHGGHRHGVHGVHRTRAMHPWLHAYNTRRPRSALNGLSPTSRINGDNVLGNDGQVPPLQCFVMIGQRPRRPAPSI